MKEHWKKMAAPLIITVLFVLYLAGFSVIALLSSPSLWIWLLMGGIPLILAGVMIAVCVQRIKEIRSGVEDDLSEY